MRAGCVPSCQVSVWGPMETVQLKYLTCLPPSVAPAYPQYLGNGELQDCSLVGTQVALDAKEAAANIHDGPLNRDAAAAGGGDSTPTSVTVVIYNVMTMRRFGAHTTFATQLKAHNVAICGSPESRPYATGVKSVSTDQPGIRYTVATSQATDLGREGCALFIAQHIPWAITANGQKCCINQDDVVVIHAEPRLLVVRITTEWFRILAVVMHIPHTNGPHDTRPKLFVNSAKQHLRRLRKPNEQLILMTDANARANAVDEHGIAQFCLLQDLLYTNNLPDATEQDADDELITWTDSRGSDRKLDYIVISNRVKKVTPA